MLDRNGRAAPHTPARGASPAPSRQNRILGNRLSRSQMGEGHACRRRIHSGGAGSQLTLTFLRLGQNDRADSAASTTARRLILLALWCVAFVLFPSLPSKAVRPRSRPVLGNASKVRR